MEENLGIREIGILGVLGFWKMNIKGHLEGATQAQKYIVTRALWAN